MSKKVKNLVNRLKDRFSRKEKIEVPESWLKDKPEENVKVDKTVVVAIPKPKVKRKIRIPFLRRFKRIIAGFMLIINFLSGIMSLSTNIVPVAILFLPTSFILLDYLWKTRR